MASIIDESVRDAGVVLVAPADMQVGFTFTCGMQGCAALPSITAVVPLTARPVSSNKAVQWICFTPPTTRHGDAREDEEK